MKNYKFKTKHEETFVEEKQELKENYEYTIEEIHESLINGQRRQMVKQITSYGLYDFFSDYLEYLEEFDNRKVLDYFSDAVISYFRIKYR